MLTNKHGPIYRPSIEYLSINLREARTALLQRHGGKMNEPNNTAPTRGTSDGPFTTPHANINKNLGGNLSEATTTTQKAWPDMTLDELQAVASVGGSHSLVKLVHDLSQEVKKLWAALGRVESKPAKPGMISWAQVAAKGEKRKAQDGFEVIIAPDPHETDICRRAGKDTLEAARNVIGPVVESARRLPDGSTALKAAKGKENELLGDGRWIEAVFGKRARVAKGGHLVLIKGVADPVMDTIPDTEIKGKFGALQITRKRSPGGYGTILCRVTDVTVARRMTTEGVLLANQVFKCEPYLDQRYARQCFNCFGWGHIGAKCKAFTKCGGCGARNHLGQCRRVMCVNCGGNHPATARQLCPVAEAILKEAATAFSRRPRAFQDPKPPSTGPAIKSHQTSDRAETRAGPTEHFEETSSPSVATRRSTRPRTATPKAAAAEKTANSTTITRTTAADRAAETMTGASNSTHISNTANTATNTAKTKTTTPNSENTTTTTKTTTTSAKSTNSAKTSNTDTTTPNGGPAKPSRTSRSEPEKKRAKTAVDEDSADEA